VQNPRARAYSGSVPGVAVRAAYKAGAGVAVSAAYKAGAGVGVRAAYKAGPGPAVAAAYETGAGVAVSAAWRASPAGLAARQRAKAKLKVARDAARDAFVAANPGLFFHHLTPAQIEVGLYNLELF
jgi:hypothetical protein